MSKYSKSFFKEMGKKGGDKTKELYGLSHYKKMRKRKNISQEQAEKQEIQQVINK